MSAGEQVVDNAQAGEKLDALESASDSQFGDLVGPECGQVDPLKEDLSLLGPVKAIHAVKEAALAGAVGAYYGQDLALVYIYTDVRQGLDSAEAKGHIAGVQYNVFL